MRTLNNARIEWISGRLPCNAMVKWIRGHLNVCIQLNRNTSRLLSRVPRSFYSSIDWNQRKERSSDTSVCIWSFNALLNSFYIFVWEEYYSMHEQNATTNRSVSRSITYFGLSKLWEICKDESRQIEEVICRLVSLFYRSRLMLRVASYKRRVRPERRGIPASAKLYNRGNRVIT